MSLLKAAPTTTINVGDAVFEVARMSSDIQHMIAYYDEWRQREIDLTSELLQVRGALRDLQTQMATAIQKEREDAAKKAEAMGLVPAAPAPAPAAPVEDAKPAAKRGKKA